MVALHDVFRSDDISTAKCEGIVDGDLGAFFLISFCKSVKVAFRRIELVHHVE